VLAKIRANRFSLNYGPAVFQKKFETPALAKEHLYGKMGSAFRDLRMLARY
jgi:hypothetical protein